MRLNLLHSRYLGDPNQGVVVVPVAVPAVAGGLPSCQWLCPGEGSKYMFRFASYSYGFGFSPGASGVDGATFTELMPLIFTGVPFDVVALIVPFDVMACASAAFGSAGGGPLCQC